MENEIRYKLAAHMVVTDYANVSNFPLLNSISSAAAFQYMLSWRRRRREVQRGENANISTLL